MIECINVSKAFNNITAIENINFNIQKGELVFLTGKSGAGKSTLINLLTLRDTPSKGIINSLGFNLSKLKQSQFFQYRRKIGVIFQDFNLIETITIYDNIALALEVMHINKKLIQKRVFSALEEVDLISHAKRFPPELSGGERQRIAVARAIINKPELLIADEPTGSLDPENANNIFESLFNLNTMGATIIIATHDEKVVSRGRQIKLTGGRISC